MGRSFMRGIRLLLAWCFAALAAGSVCMAYIMLRVPVYSGADAARPSISAKLELLSAPLLLGSIFSLAWWTVLRRKRSAWKWALAASFATAGMGFLLAFGPAIHLVAAGAAMLAIGVTGALVFVRAKSRENPAARIKRRPVPGDGTNRFLNQWVGIPAGFAVFAATQFWSGWASSHALPEASPFEFLLLLAPVLVGVMLIHEGGHLLAGIAVKMKATAAGFGPLICWNHFGKWKFQFRAAGQKSFLAFVLMVPTEVADFRWRKVIQVAGGPAANIITGIAAFAASLAAPHAVWMDRWLLLSTFANASLAVGLANLVPFAIGDCGYSDGAKLYQLLSGGFWCDYHLMLGITHSSVVTSTRPREYDIETIRRAAETIAKGSDGLFLHLSAYACHLDRGELPAARETIVKAEQYCKESGQEVPAEWSTIFVFANALLRRDAVAARAWWEKFQNHKKRNHAEEHWTSLAALLWSENRLGEAREAWQKADAWARQLHESGYAEAERNAVRLLKQAMDESAAAKLAAGIETECTEVVQVAPKPS
jgi:hypothetical protein